MDFKELTLNDLSVGSKGHYGIAASATDFSPEKNRYIRISDINDDGTLNNNDPKSVDCPDASKYLIHKNDLLVARTGASTGRSYFCDKETNNMVYAGFLIKFSIDENKVNPAFIKYHFLSEKFRRWVYAFQNGATRENLNAKTLGQHVILLPPREYQDKVVDVLKSIDDKISINNKIITVLWSIISLNYQSITKSPSCSQGKLSDISQFVNEKADYFEATVDTYIGTENIFPNKAGYTLAKSVPATGKITKFRNNDTLISNKIVFAENAGYCSNDVLCFRAKFSENYKFLHLILFQDNFFEYVMLGSKGTKMPRGDKKHIMNFDIRIPTAENLRKFNAFADPVFSLISNIRKQNKLLTKQKELLLPKLLSGEIELNN